MKSSIKSLLILFILVAAIPMASYGNEKMSVTVKKTQVRQKPSFLGKVQYNLVYGDRVEILDEKNGWFKIEPLKGGEAGWVNSSALTSKRIKLTSGSSDVDTNTSQTEVALAGKGFNSQVEEEYRSKNDIDYTWVDIMETYDPTPEEVAEFLESGDLVPEGADL